MTPTEPPPHPATLDLERLEADCDFRATRRSGPGGQNRNKVETAVVLTHRPSGITAEAAERRSQGENRKVALFRLRIRLALEVRRPVGPAGPYQPSPRWLSRCRGGRIIVSPEHDDFPALLAEALDLLEARGHDPRATALELGCSTSQLIRLLKDEPRALAALNRRRQGLGLRPLQ